MDTNEETRNGYKVSSEMKKVWKMQMDMAKLLLDVCRKYGLQVWADSGTLLGCVRDKGYLPWDDDMDFIMMRKDYDKLLPVAQKEFQDPYFFQTAYSETSPFMHAHAQIRKNGTAGILKGTPCFMNFNQGIFIDLFVLEDIPDDDAERSRYFSNVLKKRRAVNRWCKTGLVSIRPAFIMRSIYHAVYRSCHNYKKAYKEFDLAMSSYTKGDNEYVANVGLRNSESHFNRMRLKREWFSGTVMLPFEDMEMPVPAGYDGILTTYYGDYMVPRQSPSVHGGFAVLDTERSYTEYLPQLRREFRRKQRDRLLALLRLGKDRKRGQEK